MNRPSTAPRSERNACSGRHLLLFDGICALCSGVVQFVLERDRHRVFDFAPLQSTVAQEVLRRFGRDASALDTFYIVTDYRGDIPTALGRADAALFLFHALGWPWRAAGVLRLAPRFVRDRAYNVIARYRYRVFGRREQCFLPRPEDRDRFIGE
jgi:predicted DCC family thiol-disulfide oxidoreductase YuxK